MGNYNLVMAARSSYRKLAEEFDVGQNSVFWEQGHAADTIVDYFKHVDGTEASNFATIVAGLSKHPNYWKNSGYWYDDFGWWGIAGLKAFTSGVFSTNDAAEFMGYASTSWDQMHQNGPNAWTNSTWGSKDDYKNRYDGGVWNLAMNDSNNPTVAAGGGSLGGRQNTVTNGLYLILSSRLYLASRDAPDPDPAYLAASTGEYGFLKNWFSDSNPCLLFDYKPSPNPIEPRAVFPPQTNVVARERVGGFLNHASTDAGFVRNRAWAGDQGLILGGLVERMNIVTSSGSEYGPMLQTARKIMAGTRGYLTASNILLPWKPDPPPGGDTDAYTTGIAAYMRYLLSAYLTNADLKADMMTQDYQAFIYANAVDAIEHPDGTSGVHSIVTDTNNLARLVAAIVMLRPDFSPTD